MVIDTSIFIEFLRAKDKRLTTLAHLPDKKTRALPSVTLFELLMGAKTPDKKKDVLILVEDLDLLPFDETVAHKAADIYLQLRSKNQLIDFRDIFIAATAITYELPLATLNTKHFARIDGLLLQNL